MKNKYYVLAIYRDVEPYLCGPYDTREGRNNAALEHRRNEGDTDSLFAINMINGDIEVGTFSQKFLDSFPESEE